MLKMLLVVFAAIVPKDHTQLLFNAYQTNISRCYPHEASLVYNSNIDRIAVHLTPVAGLCPDFPRGVTARLVISNVNASSAFDVTYSDFQYEKMVDLNFEGIPALSKETYAVLYLFSLSETAEVRIGSFSEQKSSLSQCYDELSVVLHADSIDLKHKPSGMCQYYIVSNSVNVLKYATVLINGIEFEFNPDDVSDAYSAQGVLTQSFTAYTLDLATVRAAPVRQGKFYLSCIYDNYLLEFSSDLQLISAPGLTAGFFDEKVVQVGLFEDKFVVYAPNGADYLSTNKAQYDSAGFTKYVVRLVVQLDSYRVVLQRAVVATTYNHNYRIYEFTCDQGSAQEYLACKQLYAAALSKAAEYNFAVLFYADNDFLFGEEVTPHELASCFTSLVTHYGAKGACYEIIMRSNTDYCDSVFPPDIQISARITASSIDTVAASDLQGDGMSATITAAIQRSDSEFCYDCDTLPDPRACKAILSSIGKQGVYHFLQFYSLDYKYDFKGNIIGVLSARTAKMKYTVVNAVVFSIGGVIIAICLILSIISIFAIMKSIKDAKKKKAK